MAKKTLTEGETYDIIVELIASVHPTRVTRV